MSYWWTLVAFGGFGCLNIIRVSVQKSGNPLISEIHGYFLLFALFIFGLAYITRKYENR